MMKFYSPVSNQRYHWFFGLIRCEVSDNQSLANDLEDLFSSWHEENTYKQLEARLERIQCISAKARWLRGLYWFFNINDYAYELTLLSALHHCARLRNDNMFRLLDLFNRYNIPTAGHRQSQTPSPTQSIHDNRGHTQSNNTIKSPKAQPLTSSSYALVTRDASHLPTKELNYDKKIHDIKTIKYEFQIEFLRLLGFENIHRDDTIDLQSIRKAYRIKLLQLHPDKNIGNEKCHEAFVRLQESYEYLQDWFSDEVSQNREAELSMQDLMRAMREFRKMIDKWQQQVNYVQERARKLYRIVENKIQTEHLAVIGIDDRNLHALVPTFEVEDCVKEAYESESGTFEDANQDCTEARHGQVTALITSVKYIMDWFEGCNLTELDILYQNLKMLRDEMLEYNPGTRHTPH